MTDVRRQLIGGITTWQERLPALERYDGTDYCVLARGRRSNSLG
jgi:hypothetical protein